MHSPAQTLEIPADYQRIKVVQSFEELLTTPLDHGVNALCWPRQLPGNFDEIVEAIIAEYGPIDEITSLDEESLHSLALSPAGQIARDTLVADQALLKAAGLDPILDCIPAYPRDPEPGHVPIDVYDYHADSANIIADTYLCSYNLASSQAVRNEDAIRYVDIPEIRAKLLAQHGGPDDDSFKAFLKERFYDLHYTSVPNAQPITFGLQNLWRFATLNPDRPVPPCVHRAPTTQPGQPPRLLLIS